MKLKDMSKSAIKKLITNYNKTYRITGHSKLGKEGLIKMLHQHPHIKVVEGDTVSLQPTEEAKKRIKINKKGQTQKEIEDFESSLSEELKDPKKYNELFGVLPKKKNMLGLKQAPPSKPKRQRKKKIINEKNQPKITNYTKK